LFENPVFRYLLGFIVPYAAWFVKHCVAKVLGPWSEKQLSVGPGAFDSLKQFRLLGWDFASSSLGATIFALLFPKSGIAQWSTPQVAGFIVMFLVLFVAAILIRYLVQEDRERSQASIEQGLLVVSERELALLRESTKTWSIAAWFVGVICYCTSVVAVVGFEKLQQ
jgi:hypothetical protein